MAAKKAYDAPTLRKGPMIEAVCERLKAQAAELVRSGAANGATLSDSAAADITALTQENVELRCALRDLLVQYDIAAGNAKRAHGYTFADFRRLNEIRQLAGDQL